MKGFWISNDGLEIVVFKQVWLTVFRHASQILVLEWFSVPVFSMNFDTFWIFKNIKKTESWADYIRNLWIQTNKFNSKILILLLQAIFSLIYFSEQISKDNKLFLYNRWQTQIYQGQVHTI